MKSRRAVLVAPGRFEIEETDITPGPGQILVKMTACGLCHSELMYYRGKEPFAPPLALGHEGCGVITEVGQGVTRFKGGERVTGFHAGGFSDYFVQDADCTLSLERAPEPDLTLGEPAVCVNKVVRAAHPQGGDIIAVVGCGPMGLWCTQHLSGSIPGAIIAFDTQESKLELARSFGATHAVNPAAVDPVQSISDMTDGRMVDIVIEGTSTSKGVQLAMNLVRRGGKVIVMSSFEGMEPVDMLLGCKKAATMVFAHPNLFPDLQDCIRRTQMILDAGTFSFGRLVNRRFQLEEIATAFEVLANKPADYLKGVVVP
ncbi:MAG: zinc-binding dehydrogenase [Candidatus Latescibacterota bacterium]